MRIATVNLWNGGGRRTDALGAYFRHIDADVLVLTEYRPGTPASARLRADLSAADYQLHCHWTTANQNSVAIATRLPSTVERQFDPPNRWMISLVIDDLILTGLYAPQPRPATDFHRNLARQMAEESVPRLIIGDWNAGLHFIDEANNSMAEHDPMMALHRSGWVECWLYCNGLSRPEYTWYSPQRGNGFRIDQAFVTETIVPRIQSARYDHAMRRAGLSDHSPLIVELSE